MVARGTRSITLLEWMKIRFELHAPHAAPHASYAPHAPHAPRAPLALDLHLALNPALALCPKPYRPNA